MPDYAQWLRTYEHHSHSRAFERAMDGTRRVFDRLAANPAIRPIVSCSGGKDSAVIAGLDTELELNVPLVHAWNELLFPDTLATVEAIADHTGQELRVAQPTQASIKAAVDLICKRHKAPLPQPDLAGWTVWSLLAAVPPQVDITTAMPLIHRAIAAGNMMVAFLYATWAVNPILHWTGMDVMAYLVSRGVPIHPHYQRCHERFGGPPHDYRVDLIIQEQTLARHGTLALVRASYPAFFAKLVSIRPELRRYT